MGSRPPRSSARAGVGGYAAPGRPGGSVGVPGAEKGSWGVPLGSLARSAAGMETAVFLSVPSLAGEGGKAPLLLPYGSPPTTSYLPTCDHARFSFQTCSPNTFVSLRDPVHLPPSCGPVSVHQRAFLLPLQNLPGTPEPFLSRAAGVPGSDPLPCSAKPGFHFPTPR